MTLKFADNQKGLVPLLIIVAVFGVIIFLIIATTLPFRNALLSSLFPKGFSFASGEGISAGNMNLTSTFNSVGIELFFTGDSNENATAELEFKKTGDSTFRKGLPLHRTFQAYSQTLPASTEPSPSPIITPKDSFGDAFYGSALLLEAGTSYDIKVTVKDADGGDVVKTSTIITRQENIPQASNLVPNYFVRAEGNDLWDGTAATKDPSTNKGPWKTIAKAISSAPDNAVVQIGPGFYPGIKTNSSGVPAPNQTRLKPITLVAQYPAVNDARDINEDAKRTIIEPFGQDGASGVSMPASRTDPDLKNAPTNRSSPWQEITVTGPTFGRSYKLWKWANSPVSSPVSLGYSASRFKQPKKVAHWVYTSGVAFTPDVWAEKLNDNTTYNYGFWSDGPNVYLKLPPDAPTQNPNELYITLGNGSLLALNGPNIRVSGLEFRNVYSSILSDYNSTFNVYDHNLFTGSYMDIRTIGKIATAPHQYGSDNVIEYNRFVDSNLWAQDQVKDPTIPWNFIKNNLIRPTQVRELDLSNKAVTDGQFKLKFNNEETVSLPVSATNDQIKLALEALNSIDPGDILITGGPLNQNKLTIWFIGKYFGKFDSYTYDPVKLTNVLTPVFTFSNSYTFPDGVTKINLTANSYWADKGNRNETTAISFNGGGHRRTVIRYNTIDGVFNGVNQYCPGCDRYSTQDTDIYENEFLHESDDPFEPEGPSINWRIWKNTVRQTYTALSTGPSTYGPIYLFRNTFWQIGAGGVGKDQFGNESLGISYNRRPDGKPKPDDAVMFKYSGTYWGSSNVNPAPILYVINNSFYSTDPGTNGGSNSAGGYGVNYPGRSNYTEFKYFRNNFIRATRYAFDITPWPKGQQRWLEDYNFFATTDTTRGIGIQSIGSYKSPNVTGPGSLAEYRTTTGVGAHTNNLKGVDYSFLRVDKIDNEFENLTSGNMTLKSTSEFIDAGTAVPNIADNSAPNASFVGCSPDLGAIETNVVSSNCPGASNSPSPIPSSTPATKVGDVNYDGLINIFDYNFLLADFGKRQTGLASDIDNNGVIDIFDYNLMLTNFGK